MLLHRGGHRGRVTDGGDDLVAAAGDVALAPGADPAAVAAGLRKAVRASGGQVRTGEQWVRAVSPRAARTTRAGFLLVLGIALLYTGISLVNTMVMAASDRVRDLAVLRLAGATGGQVLRLVAGEALLVVGAGGALGLLVAAVDLSGVRAALGLLAVRAPVAVPWAELGVVAGACAVLAVVAAVLPAALRLRRGALEAAGARE